MKSLRVFTDLEDVGGDGGWVGGGVGGRKGGEGDSYR